MTAGERICANEFCEAVLDRRHAKFCSEDCRQRGQSMIAKSRGFTQEMADELYQDALAGNILAWKEFKESA